SPDRDITTVPGIDKAIEAGASVKKMAGSRVGSWFATKSDGYLSKDRQTMIATIYPPGDATFSPAPPIKPVRAAIAMAAPQGVTTYLTGQAPVIESQGESGGPSVLTEALIGAAGALVILIFVFGTLPAVLMPMLVALSSIMTTFLCVYVLTYL